MTFNHIEEARKFRDALNTEADAVWRQRINDAIDYSATGSEIMALVREALLDLLKERKDLPLDLVARINAYLRETQALFSR